ncbi:MAG TPA: hypothetical protein DCP61_07210 [Treponema sp.]|nr:hypothetical protein [Treponema sp.]
MKKSLFVFAAFIFACFFATAQDAGEILDDKTAAGVEAGADTDASLNEEAVAEGNAPADENEEASVEKSTGNAAAEFSTGEWYGNVYTNDFIGIKYELPQGWEKYGDEEIAEIMNLGKEFLNDNQKKYAELSKLTTVYHILTNNPATSDTICLITEKTFLGISANLYAKRLKRELEAVDSLKYEVDEISTKEIAGKKFTALKTKVSTPMSSITQVYYCYRLGKYMVCIIATSKKGDEGIEAMLKAFR